MMESQEAFDKWCKVRGVWPRLTHEEIWNTAWNAAIDAAADCIIPDGNPILALGRINDLQGELR